VTNQNFAARVMLFIVASVFAPVRVRTQVATADIVGQVTDPSNAVISGVTITVRNPSTGLVRNAVSDDSGKWTVISLPIGTHIAYGRNAPGSKWRLTDSDEVRRRSSGRLPLDMALEFRTESFNLTNTPNFGIPAAALGASNFGIISDTANAQARQLQFALKLLF
jgi:Carboxypeptidase regulatory-like domain